MSKADKIELWFNIPEHEDYQASSNGCIRCSHLFGSQTNC